jgi:hypothetical protein
MRGHSAKFCSSRCYERQDAAKRRKQRDPNLVVVHSCLSSEFDAFNVHKCRCRSYLGDQKIEELFKQNAARNLNPEHRSAIHWDRGDVVLIGKRVHTPRAATIDKARILRGVQRPRSTHGKSDKSLKADFAELERRVQEDKLEKSEDERHRWSVWADLQRRFFTSLTKEYSEAVWLKMERIQKTIPVYISGIGHDERSSTGKTKSYRIVDEEIEEQDAKTNATETEIETDTQSATSTDANIENDINCESLEAVIDAEEMAEAA